jgi:hypothetical protein
MLLSLSILTCSSAALADRLAVLAKVGDIVTIQGGASAQIVDISGYLGFVPPVLSEAGAAAFGVRLRKGIGNEVYAIIRASPGSRQVVVAQGDLVDGMPGVTFGGFSSPSITNSGEVIFSVTLVGSGITAGLNNKGYWIYDGSVLRPLVREGESIPEGLPNLRIGAMSEVEVIDGPSSQMLSFRAFLTNLGSSLAVGSGYFAVPRTTLALPPVTVLGLLNSSVPGIDGARFLGIEPISSKAGVELLLSTVMGPSIVTNLVSPLRIGNDTVLFSRDSAGALTKIARNGDPAPGFDGMSFYLFKNSTIKPMVNSSGVYAFAGTAMNPQGQGGSGIWTNRPDVLARGRGSLLARTGDVLTTPSGQVNLGSLFNGFAFKQHWLSEDGTIVFVAPVTGTGVNAQNNRVIVSDSPLSGRVLIARGGDPVPDVPGATFVNSTIGNWLLTNGRGDVAFMAQMAGVGIDNRNDYGIFLYSDGALRLVAREGDPLPNTDGYTLADLSWFQRWNFNDQGQLLVVASAAQTGRGSTASQGCVFRVDQSGGIRALALGNASISFEESNSSLSSLLVANPAGMNNSGRLVGAAIGTFEGLFREAIVAVDIIPSSSTPSCPADFNSDGSATVQDIFDFLSRWFVQEMGADFNRDSTVTVQDLFDFLNVWFGGC